MRYSKIGLAAAIFFSLQFFPFGVKAAQAEEKEEIMLVLDLSGSMWGQIEGKTKIEIARDALKGLVATWSDNRRAGLIVYGHRTKGDCGDIEEIIPPGPLDKEQLSRVVDKLTPKGMTPLSAAVKQAAQALKFSEKKATVVLISDGVETCNLDPCQVGSELEKLGVDFTAHVIGFDVTKTEDQKGLKCLAENTGGMFIPASNSEELNQALTLAAALPTATATSEPSPTHTPKPTHTATASPTPLPSVKLISPDSAVKGTEVTLGFEGESNPNGYVYLYKTGSDKQLASVRVTSAADKEFAPAKLRMPVAIGTYELRWQLNNGTVLASNTIEVTDAEIEIKGPSEVQAGAAATYEAEAPEGLDGYLYLYKSGRDKHLVTSRLHEQKATLRMPAEPGDYEIKWLSSRNEFIAGKSIKVVESKVSISTPDEVVAGTIIPVTLDAPEGLSGYLYLYKKGKDESITYERVAEENSGGYKKGSLRAPAIAGEYIVSWESQKRERFAEKEIRVVDAVIKLDAPSEAVKASEIEVTISAPEGLAGYLYLYLKGKDSEVTYTRVEEDRMGGYKAASLRLPARTGEYEIIFKTTKREELAKTEIKVIDAELKLSAPATVAAEESFKVTIEAPPGLAGYVYIFKKGSDKHLAYAAVRDHPLDDYAPVQLKAPKEPGEYELRWLTNKEELLASAVLEVR